jgi:hypothetical protein
MKQWYYEENESVELNCYGQMLYVLCHLGILTPKLERMMDLTWTEVRDYVSRHAVSSRIELLTDKELEMGV